MWSRVRVLELLNEVRETLDTYPELTKAGDVQTLLEMVVEGICEALEEMVRPGSSIPDEEPPEEK